MATLELFDGETGMYLHQLNTAQKAAFLVLAQRVSMSDGEDGMDELEALAEFKQQMGGAPDPDMSAVLGELDLSAFDSHRSKVIALSELLAIIYSDGYLHEGEAALIGDIAAGFGFTQEQLNAIAAWAMDKIDLQRRADAMLDAAP